MMMWHHSIHIHIETYNTNTLDFASDHARKLQED